MMELFWLFNIQYLLKKIMFLGKHLHIYRKKFKENRFFIYLLSFSIRKLDFYRIDWIFEWFNL